MVFFADAEFLMYDFKRNAWQLGDYNDSSVTVPEDAVVVEFDPQQTIEFHAISVGGLRFSQEQRSCLAMQFSLSELNCVQYF